MPEIVSTMGALGLWAVLGYLAGSIPFGMVLARLMNLGDLRKIGSGNIGATNVLRTGNKLAAFLTLLLDGGKGAVAVLLARTVAADDAAQVAALAAFLGHCYPVWLGFRGGKGVATFLGLILALAWPAGLAACLAWLLIAVVFRYSSLAALFAAGMTPIFVGLLTDVPAFVLSLVLAVLIYIRHSANISRLRAGTESRIGQKG